MVNRQQAVEAWDLLRGYARIADEVWDQPFLTTLDGITENNVNDAFRIAARYTHPDQGGDASLFVQADRAKHIVLLWLGRAPPAAEPKLGGECPACKGLGFTKIPRGFAAPLRRQCARCRGTGDVNYEHEKGSD